MDDISKRYAWIYQAIWLEDVFGYAESTDPTARSIAIAFMKSVKKVDVKDRLTTADVAAQVDILGNAYRVKRVSSQSRQSRS